MRAAAGLFYAQGIRGTSVDAVVAEAGLTKPTFYGHFRSKDDLVTAVMELRSAAWHEAVDGYVANARAPRAKLLAVFRFLDAFVASPGFRGCALVNASIEVPSPGDPAREVARGNKTTNRRRLESLAREAGLRDPKRLAASLALVFEGAIVAAWVEGDRGAARDARRAAEQLIAAHGRAGGA